MWLLSIRYRNQWVITEDHLNLKKGHTHTHTHTHSRSHETDIRTASAQYILAISSVDIVHLIFGKMLHYIDIYIIVCLNCIYLDWKIFEHNISCFFTYLCCIIFFKLETMDLTAQENTKKKNALSVLALKTAAQLKWNLEIFEQK